MGISSRKHFTTDEVAPWKHQLRSALDSVETRGSAACTSRMPVIDPELQLLKVDHTVGSPLQLGDVLAITQACSKSIIPGPTLGKYDKIGIKSIFDEFTEIDLPPQIPSRWQLEADQFEIRNSRFTQELQTVVQEVRSGLGTPDLTLGQPQLKLFGPGACVPKTVQ